jgi:hypothetical protein
MTVSISLIVACGGSQSPQAGFETGPCVDARCLDGLVCLSELCVSLDDPTTSNGGTEGSGPTTGASSEGGESPSGEDDTASDSGSVDDDGGSACNTAVPTSGQTCDGDDACQPGVCFHIPAIGGVCGECTTDADCPCGGCTIPLPEPLGSPPRGAVCNTGALGDGCESTAACQASLTCENIFEIPGIVALRTCSECSSDSGCPGAQLCSPSIDPWDLSGVKRCIMPGSLPLGSTCDHLGSGDQACSSGICAVGSFQNLADIGVCSECNSSAQCPGAELCDPPWFEPGQIVPGQCVF